MPYPISANTKSRDTSSLDAEAWINAAFAVLASNGVEAVRVERLAKSLKVTKGSFYWHFKDRRSLFDAMLASWRKRATLGVIDRLERAKKSPAERLRQLLALPRFNSRSSRGGADVEAAIRLWGRSDPTAASAINEIDRLRLGYIKSLLEANGTLPRLAAAHSMLIYAFMLAEASVGPALDQEICADCEEMLLQWQTRTTP
jgi:AcrR family transcriptional regulator